jgi:hypothetical protein
VRETSGLLLKSDSPVGVTDFLISEDKNNLQQLVITDNFHVPLYQSKAHNRKSAELQIANVLKQQVWLKDFRSSKNTQQSFTIRISTTRENTKKYQFLLADKCSHEKRSNPLSQYDNKQALSSNETFIDCEVLKMTITPDKNSFLAVFNLTMDGQFSLLYPYDYSDSQQRSKHNPFESDNLINQPYGMESIVAYAFESEFDPLYLQIVNKWKRDRQAKILPEDNLHRQLVERFTNNDTRHAQRIKNILTIKVR